MNAHRSISHRSTGLGQQEKWPRGVRSLRRSGRLGGAAPRALAAVVAAVALSVTATGAALATTPAPTPAPKKVALWSTSPDSDSMNLWRSVLVTDGLVHSEGAINFHRVRGHVTGGTEYGSAFNHTFTRMHFDPAAVKVTPGGGNPAMPVVADYRPGGKVASASSSYAAVDPAACVNGYWWPDAALQKKLSGIVYVPCGLVLRGSKQRTIDATFVAEGPIHVTKTKVTVGMGSSGPSLVSGASGDAIVIGMSKTTTRGTVYAPNGVIRVAASQAVLECGAVAQKFDLYQANIRI